MPPKTAKRIVKDHLKDLSEVNFKEFVDALLDRSKEEPRVRRVMVEGKSRLEVADVLITTFTEKGALKVAEEILRDIGCTQDADALAGEAGVGAPNPGADAKAGGGAPNPGADAIEGSSPESSTMEHFVDKYRRELVMRVSNVDPILDELLDHKVITDEQYYTITAQRTRQEKMRSICDYVHQRGTSTKDVLLSVLTEQEPYLITELQKLSRLPVRMLTKQPAGLEEHFVDKHKEELIKGVSDVNKLVEELRTGGDLLEHQYLTVRRLPTSVQMMRGIYDYLQKGGKAFKDLFLSVLQKQEPHLIADLQGQSSPGVSTWTEQSAGCGPSTSWDPKGFGTTTEPRGWTKLDPEEISTDAGNVTTYSLQSGAGHFECSVSGLRWVCEEKVGIKYQFCSWGGHMERMKNRQYSPVSPLMDVTVITGIIKEVWLSHWICIDGIPNLLDHFRVLHINDCGEVLEEVSEVTASHVKLADPNFSLLAILSRFIPLRVSCNVLMYYETNQTFLKLHVYLIPNDAALREMVWKEEVKMGYELIKKHHPDGYLWLDQGFTLTATLKEAEIQPRKITLRYEGDEPNLYEVFIETPNQDFSLELLNTSSLKDGPIWSCKLRKNDYRKSGPLKAEVTAGVSWIPGSTARMPPKTPKRILKDSLKDLSEENFKEFVDALLDRSEEPCVKRAVVEGKSRPEVADVMMNTFTENGALKVAEEILRDISCNQVAGALVERFVNEPQRP